jgi:anti-anti-sigma factor
MNQPQTAATPLEVTVVSLEGDFDIADRERVAAVFEAAAQAEVLIVDLSHTDFIDSTVFSELVKLRKQYAAREPDWLVLTQPAGSVLRLFEVSQIADIFVVRPSVETALDEIEVEIETAKRMTLVGQPPGSKRPNGALLAPKR